RRVRFLFKLAAAVETAEPATRKRDCIDGAFFRLVTLGDQLDQVMEILNSFAATQVDTAACAIHLPIVQETRILQGLSGGSDGKVAISPRVREALGVLDVAAEVIVLNLRRKRGRKAVRVEELDRANAAAPLDLGLEQFLDAVPQRRDCAHAGYDDSLSHVLALGHSSLEGL